MPIWWSYISGKSNELIFQPIIMSDKIYIDSGWKGPIPIIIAVQIYLYMYIHTLYTYIMTLSKSPHPTQILIFFNDVSIYTTSLNINTNNGCTVAKIISKFNHKIKQNDENTVTVAS